MMTSLLGCREKVTARLYYFHGEHNLIGEKKNVRFLSRQIRPEQLERFEKKYGDEKFEADSTKPG